MAGRRFGGWDVRLLAGLFFCLGFSACTSPLLAPPVYAVGYSSPGPSQPADSGGASDADSSISGEPVGPHDSPGLPRSPSGPMEEEAKTAATEFPVMVDAFPYVQGALVGIAVIGLASMATAVVVVARG